MWLSPEPTPAAPKAVLTVVQAPLPPRVFLHLPLTPAADTKKAARVSPLGLPADHPTGVNQLLPQPRITHKPRSSGDLQGPLHDLACLLLSSHPRGVVCHPNTLAGIKVGWKRIKIRFVLEEGLEKNDRRRDCQRALQ